MSDNVCNKVENNEVIPKSVDAAGNKDHRNFIETILVEMKSEFNRNLVLEEGETADAGKKSTVTKCEKSSVKNEVLETKSEKKCKTEKEKKIKDARLESEKSQTDVGSEDSKVDIEVQDVLKESNLDVEEIGKGKISENMPINENHSQVNLTEDTSKVSPPKKGKGKVIETGNNKILPDKSAEDCLSSNQPTPNGKRSLRSQTLVKTTPSTEEPVGVKRSARRRSKDSPRESVLQSAIARKEKSFSNLSHTEEKSGSKSIRPRIHRSPRMSSGERAQPLNKSSGLGHTRGSSLENVAKSSVTRIPKGPVLERAVDVSIQKSDVATDQGNNQIETTGAESVDMKDNLDTHPKSPSQALVGGQSFTKTGKRRYKPYRGLRYSFTNSPTKKSKVSKRQSKNGLDGADSPVTVKSESETAAVPSESQDDVKVEPAADAPPFKLSMIPALDSGSREETQTAEKNDIPVEVEEQIATSQPATLKRNVESEERKSADSKLMRLNLSPSPVPADVPQPEVVPEAISIPSGARTASLCLCQVESRVYVKIEASDSEFYCQAIDSVDEHSIGCYNAIRPGEVCMLRASTALQYQLLCEVHRQRLLRHNCCAGCGMFCTQGRFVMCSSQHIYHRSCSRMIDQVAVCPHCGIETPAATDFLITMQAAKNPVFLPQQKSAVKFPHAKISFGGSFSNQPVEMVSQSSPSSPLVPAELLQVPTRPEGMPVPLDRDKLDHLLSVSSSMLDPGMNHALSQRYTVKSLYQAAKTGNAEKLILVLGAGLNPNHMFRECQMGSALHLASSGGHLAAVHVLVQAGAQTDLLDREQNTPLMLAILEGHIPVVKYLVKAGASVIHKGADGMTALHLAAKAGYLEACKLLLSVPNLPRGYINSLDEGRWTALVWAAEHRHEDIVRFLLEKRADPLIRDAEQNIALHWSAFSGSVEISEMLLNHGADVNASNTHGDTPLHIGARQSMYDCVLLLLARGAKTDMKNKLGKTALDCCFSPVEDTYKAIHLNVMLQTIVRNYNKQATRILSNDISGGKEINPIQCVNWEDDAGRPTDFLYVKENCFTSSIDVDRTITSLHSCLCVDSCTTELCMCARFSMGIWYDDHSRLLPGFNYADPPMLFECNQRCSCNQLLCKNRVMQNGMTVRLQLFRTPRKGWGVQTLRPIPKGSYVCEYVGEIISDSEADHREDDSYLFDLENKDGETYCIDARDYGNVTRFINHMCQPNLTSVRVFVEHQDLHFPRIALFANRDIEANEELGLKEREALACQCPDQLQGGKIL